MRTHLLVAATTLSAAVALAGCASLPGYVGGNRSRPYPESAGVYTPGEAQQAVRVRTGTVLAVHSVTIEAARSQTGTGTMVGGAAGGLLGSRLGHGGAKTLATVAGALGGAVAGHAIAAHHYSQPALQITVRLDQGGTIAITQHVGPIFRVGERVEVLGTGGGSQPARVEPLG